MPNVPDQPTYSVPFSSHTLQNVRLGIECAVPSSDQQQPPQPIPDPVIGSSAPSNERPSPSSTSFPPSADAPLPPKRQKVASEILSNLQDFQTGPSLASFSNEEQPLHSSGTVRDSSTKACSLLSSSQTPQFAFLSSQRRRPGVASEIPPSGTTASGELSRLLLTWTTLDMSLIDIQE